MYLLDTDVLSNLLKRAPSITLIAKLAAVPAEWQFTSSITLGELLYGARRRGPQADDLLDRIETRLLPELPVLPFDASAARRYGEVRSELERRGGMEELRLFVVYVLATQDERMRRRFAEELHRQVPGPGGDTMNYVEELIQRGVQKGEQKGRLLGQIGTIENLLRAGATWSLIESATGIDQAALRALKERLEAASTASDEAETPSNGTEETE